MLINPLVRTSEASEAQHLDQCPRLLVGSSLWERWLTAREEELLTCKMFIIPESRRQPLQCFNLDVRKRGSLREWMPREGSSAAQAQGEHACLVSCPSAGSPASGVRLQILPRLFTRL